MWSRHCRLCKSNNACRSQPTTHRMNHHMPRRVDPVLIQEISIISDVVNMLDTGRFLHILLQFWHWVLTKDGYLDIWKQGFYRRKALAQEIYHIICHQMMVQRTCAKYLPRVLGCILEMKYGSLRILWRHSNAYCLNSRSRGNAFKIFPVSLRDRTNNSEMWVLSSFEVPQEPALDLQAKAIFGSRRESTGIFCSH